jgi:N-methylhydantoinase B
MKYPMPGIAGGLSGEPNKLVLRDGDADEVVVSHTADWIPLEAGQRIRYDYGGGGGWGDPLNRDPQAVLDDVLDEYVSHEAAEREYGVVLTGSLDDLSLALDSAQTTALRAERRAQRPDTAQSDSAQTDSAQTSSAQ